MFDDNWLNKNLPTFNGGKDKSIGRKMIDAVGGSNNIRTKYVMQSDGSTTMLRTRAGFPEFVTTTPSKPALVFVERDYLARTYTTVEMHFGHTNRYGYHDFDYVKTIQLFDANNREHILTFPDPYGTDSYQTITLVAPNKIVRVPVSPPKFATLSGPTNAVFPFSEPSAEIDYFDTPRNFTNHQLTFRKSVGGNRPIGVIENGAKSVKFGKYTVIFALPEDSL